MPKRNQKAMNKGGRATNAASRSSAGALGLSSNTYRVERKSQGAVSAIPSAVVGGFPDHERVTLRYTQTNTLTCTIGAMAKQVFRGNSVFDPDYTGTGAQPANFDDFAVHYNRYRVLSSSIYLTGGPSSGVAGEVVVYPWNATDVSTIDDGVAQPYALLGTSSSNASTLVNSITTSKILGRSVSEVMGSDSCGALVAGNPTDGWFWSVAVRPYDQSSTQSFYFRFVIDYDVIFFDRVTGSLDARIARLLEMKDARAQKGSSSRSDCKESDDGDLAWEKMSLPQQLVTPAGREKVKPVDDRQSVLLQTPRLPGKLGSGGSR